jgi:molecular chaperone GrpE
MTMNPDQTDGMTLPDDMIPDADQPPSEIEGEDCEDALVRLIQERDEAVAARQRALADFRNYQRRAEENESRARTMGIFKVARGLVTTLDHFDLALAQDPAKATAAQILSGMKLVRDELVKLLEANGVSRIDAKPGDEFDPGRHEAVMKQPAEGVEANHVATMFQPGYAMGDMVLRPAKVSIAP